MKTKAEVEKNWVNISNKISEKYAKNKTEFFKVKDNCAMEFMWFFSHDITEKELLNRIEKYNRFKEADNVEAFDPYWRSRLDFLKWIIEL